MRSLIVTPTGNRLPWRISRICAAAWVRASRFTVDDPGLPSPAFDLVFEDSFIFIVTTDPKPIEITLSADGQGAVAAADSHRPVGTDGLEA